MSDYIIIMISLFFMGIFIATIIRAYELQKSKLDLINDRNDQERFSFSNKYRTAVVQRIRVSTFPGRQGARMRTRIVSLDAQPPRNTNTVSYEEYIKVVIIGRFTDKIIFVEAYSEKKKDIILKLIEQRDKYLINQRNIY